MKKIYSKVNTIPKGQASARLIDGCLALEGGAFRGLYTQGFLDAMMINDINLSCVIGISAGALSGVNYVSGQIGRSGRINLTYRHDGRYVGLRAFLKSHSPLDISFLVEERGIIKEKLDEERFYRPEQRFIAVTTNELTGETVYFEKGKCNDILKAVQASATMPIISPPVMIDGVPYFDGGCSCNFPYQWAMEQGYRKILVIRTRELSYRKEVKESKLSLRMYQKYPAFARKLADRDSIYNQDCDDVERLHHEGQLLLLAPSQPVTVTRLEKDMEKLGDLYWLGYQDCIDRLEEIKTYLKK
ncbi:MAG: patatin family protein [Lachnospiraceae bacterium]|nr:patatin family protein [Lachnospiraceae bacterium]MBR6357591.1 patatin family protein [Lachnospiraceae bacterium]